MTLTVVVGSYHLLLEPTEVTSCASKSMKELRFATPSRLYVYDTILQLLAQDLQDVAAEFTKFIQEKNAVVRPRHFARQQCRPMPLFVKNVPHMTMHWYESKSLQESPVTFFTRPAPIKFAAATGSRGSPA
jgi:hypothetical protein